MVLPSRPNSNRGNNKARIIGTGVAVAVTVGATAWFLWKSLKDTTEPEAIQNNRSKKSCSRCIIVTKSIAESNEVEWVKLLAEDIVILVAPSVSFPTSSIEQSIYSKNKYKIIHCDTFAGIWACVKSLRKHELILFKDDIEGEVPSDIPRFVKHVSTLSNVPELISILNSFIN